MQDNKSQALIVAHSVKGQMSFCHGALSVVCPFINRDLDFNQHSEQPQTRSDHRRIVTGIQEYNTTVDLVIFACSNFREFLILGLFSFTKFRIFSFFFSSSIKIILFVRFWKIKTSRILPDLHFI